MSTTLQELSDAAKKVQDKRPAFAEPANDIDSDRLRQRAAIRRELGAVEVVELKVRELTAAIEASDRRRESSADEHGRTCRPIQERLQAIEAEMTTAFAAGKQVSKAIETERKDLLRQLAEANETLERECTIQKQLVIPLRKERENLQVSVAGQKTILQNKLASPPLGRRDLLDAIELAKKDSDWAQPRLRAAEQHIALNTERIEQATREREPGHAATYAGRLRIWKLEAEHVQRLMSGAQREIDRLRKIAIDE